MAPASPPEQDTPAHGTRSRVRSLLIGWVLVPTLVIGGLFAAGVHVGARHPDMLLTRGVLWLTKAEAQRAPPAVREPDADAPAKPSSSALAESPSPAAPTERPKPPESGPGELTEPSQPTLDEPVEPPPPSGRGELISLEFAWPLPARALVEEWIEKPDQSARLRYRLEVEPQGEQLFIHHRDPRLVELQGQPVKPGSKKAEVDARLLRAGFIPSMAANTDGEFVRVVDMEGYVEQTRAALASDPDANEAIALSLQTPEMLEMLEQKIGEIWHVWAELWAELELMSDRELRIESGGDLAVYRVVGLDAERITLEARIEHAFTESQVRTIFGAIASKKGDGPAKLEAELEGVTGGNVMTVTVTLRRDTSLPLRCTRHMDIWLDTPGAARRSRRETNRYIFEWQ